MTIKSALTFLSILVGGGTSAPDMERAHLETEGDFGVSDGHPTRASWVRGWAACWLGEKVTGTFLVGFHL